MGFMDTVFGGGEEAAAKAEKKALEKSKAYYQPYYEGGQKSYKNYTDYINKFQNPVEYYNDTMEQYRPSASFQNKLKRNTDIINNNAAMNGTLGLGSNERELADYVSGLLDEDEQTFWGNISQVDSQYGEGEKYLTNMGYDAAGSLSGLDQGIGKAKGNAARARSGAISNGIGTALNIAADYASGGATAVMRAYQSDSRNGGGGASPYMSGWHDPG